MSDFQRSRRTAASIWTEGYKQHELDRAQETFGLTFPPDLVALFLERRPVRGYDWRADGEHIRRMLKWPLDGLIFDVENNDLWWREWGERPAAAETRAEVLRDIVNRAPRLVPLVSHRYLPCEPNECGNPVFSIYQSDAIYYGADIADYFEREFGNKSGPVDGPASRSAFGLNSSTETTLSARDRRLIRLERNAYARIVWGEQRATRESWTEKRRPLGRHHEEFIKRLQRTLVRRSHVNHPENVRLTHRRRGMHRAS